ESFIAGIDSLKSKRPDLGNLWKQLGLPGEPPASLTRADFRAQANPDADWDGLLARYPGAQTRNFDGQAALTELDALIAYLQVLGTMVDFSTFTPDANR
ncbi:MAG: hypothetical protein ACO21B_12275, partial [Gemmobacter sp.]